MRVCVALAALVASLGLASAFQVCMRRSGIDRLYALLVAHQPMRHASPRPLKN